MNLNPFKPSHDNEKNEGDNRTRFGGWFDLAFQTSLTLAIAVLAGVFGGRWLDTLLGTSPLFIILGVLWGAGGGTWLMVLKIKQFSEQGDESD